MKKASEIYEHYKKINGLNYCEGLDDIFELIKVAQKDVIEHTLKIAAELTEDRLKNESIIKSFVIDGNSILSLKNELFKELEDES